MIWILLQFLVERCDKQIFKVVWNDGSASGNHVTLVSGLRSLALVSWRSLKIENSHPDASEAADAPEASDCTCGQKISLLSLSMVPYPPLIEELSGTIADDDQMVFPERIDSVAHDPKQAYQTWTQERACVPFEW